MGQAITPIFDTELERVKEQLATAAALRQASMTPQGAAAGGYQGGKIYTVGSPFGQIAQAIGGAYMGDKARTRQGELEQQQTTARDEWLGQMPKGVDTQHYDPVANPGTGPLVEGMEVPQSPLQQAKAMQAWAMKAPRGMEGVQNFALQQSLTAPQREAEAAQKAQDRLHELQLKAIDARATQAERLEAQKEIARMNIEGRQETARLIASLKASGKADTKPDMRFVDTVDENGNPIKQVVDMSAVKPGDTFGKPTKAPKGGKPGETAAEVLKILEQADPLIGGSTASGLGNLVDTGMGFFGKSTGGADKAAQLRSLGGILVSKMPRMEGPQSDKDVALYKEMAGRIGDPTVPTSQKRAAVETIRELNSRYSGVQYVPGGAAPEAPPVSPGGMSDDDLLKKYGSGK